MGLKFKYSLVVSGTMMLLILAVSFPIVGQLKAVMRREIALRGATLIHHFGKEAKTFIKDVSPHPLEGLENEPDVIDAIICDTDNNILAQLGGFRAGDKLSIKEGTKIFLQDKDIHFQESEYLEKNTLVYLLGAPLKDDGEIIGSIYLFLSKDTVNAAITGVIRTLAVRSLFFLVFGIIGAIIMLDSVVTKPIHSLVKDTEIIGEGNLDHQVNITQEDEIGKLAFSFNEMTKKLKKARAELIAKQKMEAEINAARRIQERLLPEEIPSLHTVELAGSYHAAKEVGGDYYDFFFVDEEKSKLGVVIADVSGKGIPGCILMAMARSVLRSHAKMNPSAADVLIKTNSAIYKDTTRGMFITALYCILDLESRLLTYASAGHNPMLLHRNRSRKCEFVDSGGMALGFEDGEVFNGTIKDKSIQLEKGDMLLLYTDGVTEAMNITRQEFGEKKLFRIIEENTSQSSKELLSSIEQRLRNFTGNIEQHDDITMAAVKII